MEGEGAFPEGEGGEWLGRHLTGYKEKNRTNCS